MNSTSQAPDSQARAIDGYRARYGHEPTLIVRAPGRVNLIGEHTDYNEGFVLPMALPFDLVIAATRRDDRIIEATSEGFEPSIIAIDDVPNPQAGWATYVHGMAHLLTGDGHRVGGWQGLLASDIPAGASLSSSAALEIAAGLASLAAADASLDPQALALVGQRVENDVMGFPSGIMDQLASAAATAGSAALIDCRDLTISAAPLAADTVVIIMDTGTRRQLVDSEYALRRADCETAASIIGVRALRDASLDDLVRLDAVDDERLVRRARHVISENQRTLDAVAAMRAGDAVTLGQLMNASHASLRDDYDVSGPGLDAIVKVAQAAPGCFGARMTGGGFAGAAVAMVEASSQTEFMAHVAARYEAPPEQPATVEPQQWPVFPAQGAEVLQNS